MTQLNPYHKRRVYPYYKVQVYKLIPKYNKWAWVDIQKAHATEALARTAALAGKAVVFRIMQVNERNRVPIFTHNENTGKTG